MLPVPIACFLEGESVRACCSDNEQTQFPGETSVMSDM